MNSFFKDVIVKHGVGTDRFDREILLTDEDYQQISKDLDFLTDSYESLRLTEEEKKLINNMLDTYNAQGARYGVVAYAQGWFDCFELIRTLWERTHGDVPSKMDASEEPQESEED